MKRFICGLLAFGLAVSLAGCENSAPAWDIAAPEYPWTTTYSAARADPDAAGTPYTDGGDTLQLQDAALFGCQMQELHLRFNAQGQLWGVSGLFPAEEQDRVIDAVAALLGEPLQKTIVIGDYYNDLEIMQTAGHSVAVANAPSEVRAAADEVTTCTCTDGAVGEYLYKLIDKAMG